MADAPQRIQRRRSRGWRMPPDTVNVTRPGKHGNPYYPGCGLGFGSFDDKTMMPVSWPLETAEDAVRHFRERMRLMQRDDPAAFEALIGPLRGKNIACWCKVGEPCHGDVWLELANANPAF